MNRLANETSPYLRQHAANPVDWYPWGEEALARARHEDKPILLSIGYSACHWCHVMAHESFEDRAVAQVMNEHFVNIKVDREERPDVDQIYQTAHQMLTQRPGGWPLTMFLTPDQVPFFGGTYFPQTPRHNLPGFVPLMLRVVEAYRTRRTAIDDQNRAILAAFGRGDQAEQPRGRAAFDRKVIIDAIAHLAGRFDSVHGGFGAAPKFPHPADLELAMRAYSRSGDTHALHIALHTLEKMASGGIYDHLGGGFARYSVDAQWMIPHFEKMLYDNGPLLALYADAWRITKRAVFKEVVSETAGWLMREMQSAEGGYFSSLDADSEGEEGRFYRWDRAEVENLLDADEYRLIAQYYGLAGAANFEGHHWHLHVIQPLDQAADRAALTSEQARALLAAARAKLFDARERRVRPARDEKILTSWNALAITGMARAARAFDRGDWLDSAERAMRFVREVLWRNGRLLATYKDGYAHLNAYLDDYAYLLQASLELVQARFDADLIGFARALADALLAHFEDDAAGGFFFTSHDHERLIHRPKQGYDGATPAGNAIAAFGLQRLGYLLAEPRYLAAAERAIGAFYASVEAHPHAYAAFLAALDETLEPPRIIVVRGEPAELHPWVRAIESDYRSDSVLLAIGSATYVPEPALAKPAPAAGVNAYVCQGVSCSSPVETPTALAALLGPARSL